MIIIQVQQGETLDRALKRFKKKFQQVGVVKELRERQAYQKKSVVKRMQRKNAIYKQVKQQKDL